MRRLAIHCATILLAASGLAADVSDLQPKTGRGTPPPNARGNGPWMTRVMLATSTNGLDFARLHFVISDQAGVPTVVVGSDKRPRIYYADFGNGNILACALQQNTASLTNWIYHRIHIAGLPPSQAQPVDPAVVTLDDGHFRLYFMQPRPLPAIYSAISTNGVDFVAEPGCRFAGGTAAEPVSDPTVLKTKSNWLLWCGPEGRYMARSADGLAFTTVGEFKVNGAPFMPWSAVALPNGAGYRLYGNFLGPGEWSGGISSVFSTNGLAWNREPGIRFSLDGSRYRLEGGVAADNGCAILPDGKWLLAYVATIPVPRPAR